ncbi:helix-turn-helix domain-containing protein [Desulfotignum balticum]|uniref:helix-turn-helix domain-containing protein n=1 Tax=Desulfotignum balticum TaxID=115781 RepID=UPI0004239043|nr:helix-turn-helix domain-containing protein [Desulfotignum balticum]
MEKKDRILNVEQVRDRLKCSRAHVYNLINTGVIDAFRVGRQKGVRVKESVVARFIAEQEFREGA